MEKRDIVKRFFEEGFLLSPQALEQVTEKNIDDIIRTAKEKKLKVIENLNFLEEGVNVTVSAPEKKRRLSPKDFLDFYNRKYEGIKALLLKKMQAISINNAKNTFSDVAVIGMIKEMTPQGFVLEDPTGEMPAVSREPGISEDDVIGVTGFVREGKIINSKVIYPDIPLNREIGRISLNIMLTTKVPEKTHEDYVFTRDASYKGSAIALKSNPCWVMIRKGNQSINMVKIDIPKETDPEEVTQWLRKRHLPEKGMITSSRNDFLLEKIPEIVWINSSSRWTKIYKGVVMISMTEKDAARINLDNKEIHIMENI